MEVTTLQQEFNAIKLFKIFEIPVIDRRTNENTFVIFDIEITNLLLKATHEALTTAEEQSKYIAFESVNLDIDYTIDYHLQDLYSACNEAIVNSDFFNLKED